MSESLSEGFVYIDNGAELNSYECFIDTEYVKTVQTSSECNIVQMYKNTPYYPDEGSSNFSYQWSQVSIGSAFCIGNDYYGNKSCMEITFTTPENLGASDSIDIELLVSEYVGTYVTGIAYALCTSNINRNKYVGTSAEVSDDYQLVSTYGVDNGTTLQVDNLTSNTTYYLYLWPTSESSSALTYFSAVTITANYLDSYTTNGFLKYAPYIDNGTSWEPL